MLPYQMTYSSGRQQDLTHSKLLIFLSYLSIKEVTRSIYIFLKACWGSSPCWHIKSNLFCGSMTKILSTMTKNFMVFYGAFVFIFDSMLKIFITPSNREQSICNNVRKILSLMTKICMVFFGVFVCFAGIEAENQRGCIYRGPWMLWTT